MNKTTHNPEALAQIALGVAETHRNRAAHTGNLEDAAHARRYQAMGEALSEINRQLNPAPRRVKPGSQADWEAKHG